ncbi:unnamed protein product, partial [marine sediment metagenome]
FYETGPEYQLLNDEDFPEALEDWLNVQKVVEYELWSQDWKQRVESGKWKDYPGYASAKKGHIALQDHGSFIWFRNIKIREIH